MPADNETMDVDTESPAVASTSSSSAQYKLRYILSGHQSSISSLKFSADGSMLASAGNVCHGRLLESKE
ncbi:hypothetical protein FA15DRAFT_662611 [Coprinopsis marcescibilis]|uniref:WD40 repeat-like protein n=1 Tax=Coprinopsis marcescibilis TaxID=230819 RepID=A0A5C3LCX4_COPMA|nr:hypothetical protein FA15DRAFT_662611 [Coprinopsis marcescibilis]